MDTMVESKNDWQTEEDYRTLTRAAEVMANKKRLRAAMSKMSKTQKGMDRLHSVLTSHRLATRG